MILTARCEWCRRQFKFSSYSNYDKLYDDGFMVCLECRTGTVVETPADRAREDNAR